MRPPPAFWSKIFVVWFTFHTTIVRSEVDICQQQGKSCVKIPFSAVKNGTGNSLGGNPCYWKNHVKQTDESTENWRKDARFQLQNAPYNSLFTCTFSSTQTCAVCPSEYNTGSYSLGTSCTGQQSISDTGYYAVVKVTGVSAEDYGKAEIQEAASMFEKFLTALNRYDCDSSFVHRTAYSAWNCEDCRKAYAAWLCSQFMTKCTINNGISTSCTQVRPCLSVCNNVVQKCPVSLGFLCPDYEGDYNADNNASGCNNMAIAEAHSTKRVSFALLLAIVMSVLYQQSA